MNGKVYPPSNPRIAPVKNMTMQAPLESEHMHSIKGLVAVVTGAGSGIGQIMAKALEHNGAKVYILGRQLSKLEETAKMAVSWPIPFPAIRLLMLMFDF